MRLVTSIPCRLCTLSRAQVESTNTNHKATRADPLICVQTRPAILYIYLL